MSYPVTHFIRPYGRRAKVVMRHIHQKDADWLASHNVKVSMEDTDAGMIVYADYGKKTVDGEPDEHLLIVKAGETAFEAMERLVNELTPKVEKLNG